MIDWARLAVPQADDYDSTVCLHLLTTTTTPLRPAPYAPPPPSPGLPAAADGAICVRYLDPPLLVDARLMNAPLDHPNIAHAVDYVRRWPAGYAQLCRLVHTLHPLLSKAVRPGHLPYIVGSSSHSEEARPGAITVTVHDPLGAAQALVHEAAHHKLRALGVSMESASRLIVNDPTELYDSPIRKDRQRPMTALFHAQYSFVYVAALDLQMLAQESDPQVRERIIMLLARNLPRLEMGLAELDAHLSLDSEGRSFNAAFRPWTIDILRRGNAVLAANGYGLYDPPAGP